MEELEALVALNHFPSIGSVKIRLLLNHFETALAALNASIEKLALLPGFGPKVLKEWRNTLEKAPWKHDLTLVERFSVQLIPFNHYLYPKNLLNTLDFPILLYVLGDLQKKDCESIAVVGTRQATTYGLEMARQMSKDLASAGFTVVSGLARGIDTAAHEGALESGRTLAVLGSGIASIYPRENIHLAKHIQSNGALISEFPMQTPPDRQNFPQRNRIVSGMTLGTLLIEAPEHSGGMLTAKNAMNQKRALFALPGRADQEYFKGNHQLIKKKHAELVEDANDIIHYFRPNELPLKFNKPFISVIQLEKEEELLLNQLPNYELNIEEIVKQLQMPIAKLNVILMSLVLKKVIKEYPGKIYKKITQ